MSAITRILTAVAGACAALFAASGTSHAELDDAVSLVDGLGRTLTVQQWDTFLDVEGNERLLALLTSSEP